MKTANAIQRNLMTLYADKPSAEQQQPTTLRGEQQAWQACAVDEERERACAAVVSARTRVKLIYMRARTAKLCAVLLQNSAVTEPKATARFRNRYAHVRGA